MLEVNTKCSGCKACQEVCPRYAISFIDDKNKFAYPHIDSTKCIECHLCEKVCPSMNPPLNTTLGKAFYGVHLDAEVVKKSSSGGAFTALYRWAVSQGYIVYGVSWQEHLQAKYERAVTEDECSRFRKSKYICADSNQQFARTGEDLSEGNKVLFSGVPCSCAALLNYLKAKKIPTTNLLLVDVICHGAGSQKLFDNYIFEEEKSRGQKIVSLNFRYKPSSEFCQKLNSKFTKKFIRIKYQDGTESVRAIQQDAYLQGYYNRLFYRPSCHTCVFANPYRVTDITLGDAWGIGRVAPPLDPLVGVSLILANTDKGWDVVQHIQEQLPFKEIGIDWAIQANDSLREPISFHKNRDKFFEYLPKFGFKKSVFKATKEPIKKSVKIWLCRRTPKKVKDILKALCQ